MQTWPRPVFLMEPYTCNIVMIEGPIIVIIAEKSNNSHVPIPKIKLELVAKACVVHLAPLPHKVPNRNIGPPVTLHR